MTKKDYVRIASVLRGLIAGCRATDQSDGSKLMWFSTVDAMAGMLAADNPRFDRDKFYAACGAK